MSAEKTFLVLESKACMPEVFGYAICMTKQKHIAADLLSALLLSIGFDAVRGTFYEEQAKELYEKNEVYSSVWAKVTERYKGDISFLTLHFRITDSGLIRGIIDALKADSNPADLFPELRFALIHVQPAETELYAKNLSNLVKNLQPFASLETFYKGARRFGRTTIDEIGLEYAFLRFLRAV